MALVSLCATLIYLTSPNITKSNFKSFIKSNFPNLYTDIRTTISKHDSEIYKIGIKLGLPEIKLKLSRKDIAHFSELYRKYEDPKYGVKYYGKHNKWRKAELEYGEKTYKIKIKAHGRSPNNHKKEKHISYAIKLKKGEQIDNARRFSLIIRERIQPENHIMVDLITGKKETILAAIHTMAVAVQ